MNAIRLAIPDVVLFEPRVFGDERGFFYESFNGRRFEEAIGRRVEFVQDNHSKSSAGVLRGLHYQLKQAQGKLVRVVSGRKGIKRSAAVIVSDEGEFLFKRCLVEELLQGLGPMNDDEQLTHSVFNDSSRHSRFTVFDQIILNMLYDPRIKPGMSMQQTRPILPLVARDARRRVR